MRKHKISSLSKSYSGDWAGQELKPKAIQPIIQLWMLRMLIPMGLLKKTLRGSFELDDDFLETLGLSEEYFGVEKPLSSLEFRKQIHEAYSKNIAQLGNA